MGLVLADLPVSLVLPLHLAEENLVVHFTHAGSELFLGERKIIVNWLLKDFGFGLILAYRLS
jgi:hypothetical protein